MRNVWMIERSEHLGFSVEPSEPLGVRREGIWQDFQGIVSLESRVLRAPNLAHAALAEERGDFIGAEAAAGANGHVGRFYMASDPWVSLLPNTQVSLMPHAGEPHRGGRDKDAKGLWTREFDLGNSRSAVLRLARDLTDGIDKSYG